MRKTDLLTLLSGKEAAKAIDSNQSQITRMPEEVPKKYQGSLLKACRRKFKQYEQAYNKIKGVSPRTD